MERYTEETKSYLRDPEKYWIEKLEYLTWFNNWEKLHNYEPGKHENQWFIGGKINLSYELLDKKVEEGYGHSVAFIAESPCTKTAARYTFNEILEKVSRVAGVLSDCGVRDGDHVSIYLPTIPESVIAMLAAVRLGAVYSNLSTIQPEAAMAVRFDDFKPKVIITTNCEFNSNGEPFNPKHYTDTVLQHSHHKPERIIVLNRKCAEPTKLFPPRDVDWDEALSTAKPHDCVPIEINRPVFVIYTSGTTGKPKGIVISALYVASNLATGQNPKPGQDMSNIAIFCASPYIWIGGQMGSLYKPLLYRIPFIIWEKATESAIEETLKLLTDHPVIFVFMAVATIRTLIKQDPDGKIAAVYRPRLNIRLLLLGGAPMDAGTFKWVREHLGIQVVQIYGFTEGGTLTTTDNSNGRIFSDHPQMSSGNIMPGVTVKILRPDGSEADLGEVGNIALELPLPLVCSGFLGDKNRQDFIGDYLAKFPGYFDTHDEGRFDSEGHLYVLNRTDSMFKIGGNRISCDALEEVIMSHPDVAECVVVTRIKPDLGELPVGLFVLNEGVQRSGQDIAHQLETLVASQIGNWTTFDELIHVESIPKCDNGKIARGNVKAMVRNSLSNEDVSLQDLCEPVNVEDSFRPGTSPYESLLTHMQFGTN